MKNYTEMVGKQVKDMYGSTMGKVVGVVTDIDGSVQFVGINGYDGVREVSYEQIVVQSDFVVYIPKWRLDSQKLIREKSLILKRLRSLMAIIEDNDGYEQDAEAAHFKYKTKLQMLSTTQEEVSATLLARLEELEGQSKMLKLLSFDAKVQFKSDELSERSFDAVKIQTGTLVEHIASETAEIADMQRRFEDLDMEVAQALEPAKAPQKQSTAKYAEPEPESKEYVQPSPHKPHLEHSANAYLSAPEGPLPKHDGAYMPTEAEIEDKLPMVPTDIAPVGKEKVAESVEPEPVKTQKSDWLSRMESQ